MPTDESTPAVDPHPNADTEGVDSGEDETLRRFREALARKQNRGHLGGTAAAAAQPPHAAPAKRSRAFRRKSG